jgi:hypothetical protein
MARTATNETGKTYDGSVEEIAARLGHSGADPALVHNLSRRVRERAAEMSDYIIEKARERPPSEK